MSLKTRRLCAVALVCGSLVALGAGPGPASAVGPTLSVTPNEQLTDGQFVDVSWTGFEPDGEVRVRLCPADVDAIEDCAKDSPSARQAGDSRLVRSGDQGQGSTPFVIKAADVEPISGGADFFCDAEHPCKLIGFELDDQGNEIAFNRSASQALDYAISTMACAEHADRVAGSGASSGRAAITQWQAETCRQPLDLNVSFSTSNSVNGKQAFVERLTDADYAVSAVPLTQDENAALQDAGVDPVYAPVALGSLVLMYNLWYDSDGDGVDEQVRDLQLSPATAAAILQGRISNWNDPAIASDNPHHTFTSKRIKPVGRADNSAATWWLSSWLYATARQAWEEGGTSFEGGPTTIFPAGNAVVLRTGTDAVAREVRLAPGEPAVGDVPEVGLIGFVYMSEALKQGLPVAALRNPSGAYVKATPQSLAAAISAGDVSREGVFAPNFNTTDPAAYPLPVVTYVIAPKGTSETPLQSGPASTLKRFLNYAVTEGQADATLRGYEPLPAAFVDATKAAAPTVMPVKSSGPTQPSGDPADPSSPAQGEDPVTDTAGTGAGSSQTGAAQPTREGAPTRALGGGSPSTAPDGPIERVVAAVSGVVDLVGGGLGASIVTVFAFGLVTLVVGRALARFSS